MSRSSDLIPLHVRFDATDQTIDTHVVNFTCPRPFYVDSVKIVPRLPFDTDSDTLAVDVSYSTDGFSSSDVEIAALAATEFNDTDNELGTVDTSVNIALTAASEEDIGGVRVPAGAVIQVTLTHAGASADGIVDLYVWGYVI